MNSPGRSEMPRKFRELIGLEKAGFVDRGGRGGHRNYEHPRGHKVTLSGKPGVIRAIQEKKSCGPLRVRSRVEEDKLVDVKDVSNPKRLVNGGP